MNVIKKGNARPKPVLPGLVSDGQWGVGGSCFILKYLFKIFLYDDQIIFLLSSS